VSTDIDATLPSAELRLLRALTDYSNANDGIILFAPTVVRYSPEDRRPQFWVMNQEHKGWASYGEPHPSLWTVARVYRLAFVGIGQDEHGPFYRVVPLGPRMTAAPMASA